MSGDKMVRAGAPGMRLRTHEEAWRFAETIARASGFIPGAFVGKPANILCAITTGAELGIGPMQSLRSIHVVDGRPTLSAELMLSLAISAGVRHRWLEQTSEVARLRLTRDGFEPHEHSFTFEEAKKAGLTTKTNWKSYPAAMLRARCLSTALRAFCPDVLGSGVYVEGELDDEPPPREPEPPRHGDTVDGEIAPPMDEQVAAAEGPVEPSSEVIRHTLPVPERMADCEYPEQLRGWLAQPGRVEQIARSSSATIKVVDFAAQTFGDKVATEIHAIIEAAAAIIEAAARGAA